jgi:hypothetical protein
VRGHQRVGEHAPVAPAGLETEEAVVKPAIVVVAKKLRAGDGGVVDVVGVPDDLDTGRRHPATMPEHNGACRPHDEMSHNRHEVVDLSLVRPVSDRGLTRVRPRTGRYATAARLLVEKAGGRCSTFAGRAPAPDTPRPSIVDDCDRRS